jgi:N-acetylglucosaminyldiphosphoundecaprenol N-acetyl-beta-D-mannosaminyltransferase
LKGYRVYFLGATQDVLDRALEQIQRQHPTLRIVGTHHGYFPSDESRHIAELIRETAADLLFVGMSSPRKEYFLSEYLDLMKVPFAMGVGGSFDIMAGHTSRAPVWMQRAGMEWLYRVCCEPQRLWKRYLTTNTIFLGLLAKAFVTERLLCRSRA